MSKEQIAERIKNDCDFFVSKCLWVIDKVSNTHIPFRLNKIQSFYSKNRGKFNMIVKSRKGGVSTIKIARTIWKCAFKKNQRAVLLTQNDDATSKMLRERIRPLIESSEYRINCKIKESSGMIEFPEMNSTYYAGTAGAKAFGRGSDITDFHLSEFAHWENPDVITGVEEAMMEDAEGDIETTVNGINFCHQLWKKSEAGQSRYKPLFIPWFWDDTYRIKGIVTLDEITEEEKALIKVFGVDMEQLAWRRGKIRNMSDPRLFPQEYPATAQEAFISSGKMVFDWVALAEHEQLCCDPKWTGYLMNEGESIRFTPDNGGPLEIWELPEDGHVYIIGADAAEGVKDGDSSSAIVIDCTTSEQVAEYHGVLPPDVFGERLMDLGYFYNNAMLAPESWPGVGMVTTAYLVEHRYPNIYKRDKSESPNKAEHKLYGFENTSRTKPLVIHALAGEGIREFRIRFHSRGLLDELRSFVHHNGEMGAQEGCHDDRVIACAVAFYIMRKYSLDLDSRNKTLREIFFKHSGGGNAIEPQWKGPRYGVREN